MIAFLVPAGLAVVATLLLTSGAWHAARFGEFRALVRAHGIVPEPLAAVTTVAEIACGASALALLVYAYRPQAAAGLFAATTVLGLGFLAYVRQLLRRPVTGTSCGCSPLSGALTPAARVPGLVLTVASGLGLLSAVTAGDITMHPLAWLWGVTVAATALLAPAVAPRPQAEGSH